jgi:hypothetical protein
MPDAGNRYSTGESANALSMIAFQVDTNKALGCG